MPLPQFLKHRHASAPLLILSTTLKTFFFTHLFLTHIYTLKATRGPSMLPTLEVFGDSVLISRYFRRGRDVKVGDVVSFDSVVVAGEEVIKRVVGMQGDFVVLQDEAGRGEKMLQVPEGHCWVVGDNLSASRDSRHFGPMPMAVIKGKVVAKVFPWSERRWMADGLRLVETY
ncbi:Mitochondrial inner membrane protease subunit [Lachnellula hyalina]|uniref:Mitochondrial inner membrane protease subunit n=1 Tax=Lachnellula hyalina TaxID=1316788 RepID=A0A8H8R2L7_9HELO|nr:Mitochondrial inner membrane protease subunit [Lachnellula hyalina]TVY25759.1 Mitochondrial inner membrane protease subunit [Lachnellula hyalina]